MANVLTYRGVPGSNTRQPLDGNFGTRYRQRLLRDPTGGIIPPPQTQVTTGGQLPPQLTVPTMTTGGQLAPKVDPTKNPNDAVLPPIIPPPGPQVLPPVTTGGVTPPTPTVPTVNTGGQLPPLVVPPVNTGGQLPPSVVPPVNTGGQLPPTPQIGQFNPMVLPALDGSQYVATATGGQPAGTAAGTIGNISSQFQYTGANGAATAQQLGEQFAYNGGSISDAINQFGAQYGYTGANVVDTVKNMASQFAYNPGESPTSVAQRIAAQFNTTPDQLPAEVVQGINAAFAAPTVPGASQVAMQAMDDLLSREGSYITNARRRGLEQAGSRGLINSTIAAGTSQRAALDAAQPIFSEIMGLTGQREAQDFNAMMQSRAQAFGLTSDREDRTFQRDMAGMELAGNLESMDRQALIDQAQQAMALAGQLEGQERQAALAQAQQKMALAGQMEMQDRDANLAQALEQFQLAGQLEGQEREAALAQARDAFNAAQQLSGQREQNNFMGNQAQLDRTQGVNNALLGSAINERQQTLDSYYSTEQMRLDAQLRQQLQSDTVAQQDWLSDRQFTREFNGALSTMAIGGAYDLNRAIMDYAAQNPEVYTPEIISGMTNFFQMNMTGLLQQYFPNLMGGNGT